MWSNKRERELSVIHFSVSRKLCIRLLRLLCHPPRDLLNLHRRRRRRRRRSLQLLQPHRYCRLSELHQPQLNLSSQKKVRGNKSAAREKVSPLPPDSLGLFLLPKLYSLDGGRPTRPTISRGWPFSWISRRDQQKNIITDIRGRFSHI